MNNGFYTALGTPLDDTGKLQKSSFEAQIERQIDAKAAGFLCMGSMGNMVGVRESEYFNVAKTCVLQNRKRLPLMIGVMDNSIGRVLDRVNTLDGLNIDGVVATTPYYYRSNQEQIVTFYDEIAKKSKFPLFMYDLPGVTQSPITADTVIRLMKNKNIKGIKSGNMNLLSEIMRCGVDYSSFDMFYSGLDTFDIALKGGITKNLDGMFASTPVNSEKMYHGDNPSKYLNNILSLRNMFIKHGVLNSFSYAMGLLGCPGHYHEDYTGDIGEDAKREIKEFMSKIGEI
ncbi:MAG: dihydrodipicolinate synthase family protein [Clostridia bacterium]|nr:dihydrodipicolinate synthase family protein [Clostridia bacterium]